MQSSIEEVLQVASVIDGSPAPASRGGRGRGRGRRGRGGRGARGGRAPAAEKPAGIIKTHASRWRGRGRARKVLDNPRIQAVLDRRHELKRQYRVLVTFQKAGLEIIRERSHKLLTNTKTPDYYKTLPEYEEVERRLQRQEEAVVANHDRKRELELDLAERTLAMNTDYENKAYDVCL
jgi:hypothetical protein